MNPTRWVFVVLFAAAIGYEIIAACQCKGNTISEMIWDLFAFNGLWRWAMGVLFLLSSLAEVRTKPCWSGLDESPHRNRTDCGGAHCRCGLVLQFDPERNLLMKRKLFSGIAIALCLILVACTQTQVINDINIALDAASVALPIIATAAGVPAPMIAELTSWVQLALKGLAAVSDDLVAGGNAQVVASKITADLAGVVASVPQLQGLPASVAGVVQTLANEVKSLMTTYGSPVPVTAVGGALHKGIGYSVNFSEKDKARLLAAKARAVELAGGR